jgi:hypothetical protein
MKRIIFLTRASADFERMLPLYRRLQGDARVRIVFCGDFTTSPIQVINSFQLEVLESFGSLEQIEDFAFVGARLIRGLVGSSRFFSKMLFCVTRNALRRHIIRNLLATGMDALVLDNIAFEEGYLLYEIYKEAIRAGIRVFIIGHGAGEALKQGWGVSHTRDFGEATFLALTKEEFRIQKDVYGRRPLLIGDLRYSWSWIRYLKDKVRHTPDQFDFGILADGGMEEAECIVQKLIGFLEINRALFSGRRIIMKPHPRVGIDGRSRNVLTRQFGVRIVDDIDTIELISQSECLILSDMSSTVFEPLILCKKVIILKNIRRMSAIFHPSPLEGLGNFYISENCPVHLDSFFYDELRIREVVLDLCWAGLEETDLESRAARMVLEVMDEVR